MKISARAVASAAVAVIAAGTALQAASDSNAGVERKELQRSWTDTCERYDSETQWSALQACNLEWFREHEKAVWRLNLNPHAAVAPVPPPS